MDLEIVDPNTCIRGCCRSDVIPLHLSPSSYSLSNLIARGAESGVYQAILKGKNVAAKKPILSTSEDIDKFHKQLQILCKVDHPGIAKLIAAHARPPNYLFFFEFYGMGDLSGKLHVEEWSPSVDQALTIIYQLAKSLQYLHNLGIIHRDVKAANVLLDINLHPHLADFGLAQYKHDLKQVSIENWRSSGKPTGGFHKKNMVGTLIYMAPEVLRKEIHTEKSDVYSFGVTINELLTGIVPYTDLRAAAQAHTVLEMNYTEQQLTSAVVSEGLRPNLPDLETLGAPPGLLSLIQRCWATNPQNRPSFDDIVLELDPILESRNGKKLEITCAKPSISLGNQMSNPMTYQKKVHWYSEGENFSRRSSHAENSGVRIWPDLLTNGFAYQPVLCWGSFATCGRRETMEDAHFLMPHLCSEKDIHVFGIFDGHRGAEAAEFSTGALPGLLRSLGSTNSPSDALLEAFVETDAAFRHELQSHRKSKRATPKNWNPGCTAIVALIVRNKLFVANAGDCRAILCRASSAYSLSKDHIASCVDERERVMKAGGLVKWQVDTWRVGEAALQVTRSIGDDDLKPAVTAEPEITETMISSMDEYMVMASDGLWDVMSNEDIINVIRDTVKEPGMCSKRLATEAAERGSKDNITVIVVFLRPVSTAERIY